VKIGSAQDMLLPKYLCEILPMFSTFYSSLVKILYRRCPQMLLIEFCENDTVKAILYFGV
jgi:hypothetical protein